MTLDGLKLLTSGFLITVIFFGVFAPLFGYKPSDTVSMVTGLFGAISCFMLDKSSFVKRFFQ
jgi:hypothetical protein